MTQKLEDSGDRRTFSTGAVRDRGGLKPRPDLISPHAQMREGMIMTLGAEKYDTRNWERGMPISDTLASAQRHIEQYKRGDTNEDHIAQARWNLGVIIHFEEEIKAGRMDPSLDDLPKYAKPLSPCPRCGDVMVPAYNPETGAECYCEACGLTSLDVGPQEQTETRTSKDLEKLERNAWKVPSQEDDAVYTGVSGPLTATEVSEKEEICCGNCGRHYTLPINPYACIHCPICGWIPSHECEVYEHIEPTRAYKEHAQPRMCMNGIPVAPTFYVAGPMRGHKDLNFAAFDAARDRGKALGFNIISPADLDREHGIDPLKDPTVVEHENTLSPAELREIVQRDIDVISSLRVERGDGIAVLNGWGDSTGATAEVALARWLGLKIVWASDFHTPALETEVEG